MTETETEIERDDRLAQLLEEALAELRDKGTLDVKAWQTRYPEHATQLGSLMPTLHAFDTAVGNCLTSAGNPQDTIVLSSDSPNPNEGGASAKSAGLPPHFGRYRVVARLGRGAMGAVYKAEDAQLQRTVAIKVPHFEGPAQSRQDARLRFLREARAAAAVRHTHVCPVYDVGEQDGVPYAVMAYVEGQSLAEALANRQPLDDRRAVELARQVAEALSAVHAHGITHRDLKPGNILLDHSGQAQLADFGLARNDHDAEHLTIEGALVGTPAYMSPEQTTLTSGNAGPRSDIYSLGVVLYQMLTGRLPFEGPVLTVIRQIGAATPPSPRERRPDLDPALEAIVLKAMARDPADRYASAREFAEALAGAFERPAATVQPPSPEPIGRRTPAWRWLVAAAVAGVLVVGAALAALALFNQQAEDGSAVVKAPYAGVKIVIDGKIEKTIETDKSWETKLSVGKHSLVATGREGDVFDCNFLVRSGQSTEVQVAFPPPPLGIPEKDDPLGTKTHESIPAAERFDWQPKALVDVIGSHAWHRWGPWAHDGHPQLAFGKDGKQVLITSYYNDTIRIADAQTDKTIRLFHRPRSLKEGRWPGVSFSADGEFVALLSGPISDQSWSVWETSTGNKRPPLHFAGRMGHITRLAFSPGGKLIALTGGGEIALYDGTTGKQLPDGFKSPPDRQGIPTPLFSLDGKRLILAGMEEKKSGRTRVEEKGPMQYCYAVKVFDLETKKETASFETRLVSAPLHPASMTISPDGRWLAIGDEFLEVWDLSTAKEWPQSTKQQDGWNRVTFSPDSKVLACGLPSKIKMYDLPSGKERLSLPDGALGLTYSPDGKMLASLDYRMVRVWDAESGKQLHKGADGFVLAAASPNGHKLALFSDAEGWANRTELLLHDSTDRKTVQTFRVPSQGAIAFGEVALSQDGKHLAANIYNAGSLDLAKVWNLAKGEDEYVSLPKTRDPKNGSFGGNSLAFSRDGKALWTVPNNGEIATLWDLSSGKERGSVKGNPGAWRPLALSPDTQTLARAEGQNVTLQDLSTGKVTKTLTSKTTLAGGTHRLAFSRDGKRLLAGGLDGFQVWDLENGKVLLDGLLGDYHASTSIGFGPDDQTVVSTGLDGRIIQWRSAEDRTEWQLPGPINSATLVRNGRYLITSNSNGTIYVFRLAGAAPDLKRGR